MFLYLINISATGYVYGKNCVTLRLMKRIFCLLAISLTLTALYACAADHEGRLDGKHVALLGDSNTNIGGDDCSNPTAWSKWFVDSLRPASCRSYARSGATWTNTAATKRDTHAFYDVIHPDNVIYNQVWRLIEATGKGSQPVPDLVIIAAGTNDAWFGHLRPGALAKSAVEVDTVAISQRDAASLTTLAESVTASCRLLKQHFPSCRIILLTPHQTTKAPDNAIHAVADVIDGCGKRLGLPVIRQDRASGIVSADEARQLRYTYDGCHTSVEGGRHVGNFIASEVEKLYTH